MNVIAFENEIILYWDKEWELDEKPLYRIIIDGKESGSTQKTHFTLEGLSPETEYNITVERVCREKNEAENIFSEVISTSRAKNRLDVTKAPYFAKGDGAAVNTAAIQRALNDCTENDLVYIPEGTFLTGALNMHSNSEIYIEKNAVLQGTARVEDYLPKVKSRFEGTEMMCCRSLLNLGDLDRSPVYNCKNVIIRGKGSILGGGAELCQSTIDYERELLREYLEENADYVATCENKDTIPGRVRGRLICMNNCENIVISGLTLGYAASWNIHMVYSRNIVTCGCFITSEGVWNGDGWDPDSSENCTLFNTVLKTHDNGVAIKSGKNPEGNKINRPSRNIRVFDCSGRHGVAMGSEISGGVDGVYMWDCSFPTCMGTNIKTTVKRGGYVKNVRVKDCDMLSVYVRTRLGFNNDGESADTLTELCGYTLENIHLYADPAEAFIEDVRRRKYPIFIDGFDDKSCPVRDISFKNITFERECENIRDSFYFNNAENVTFE